MKKYTLIFITTTSYGQKSHCSIYYFFGGGFIQAEINRVDKYECHRIGENAFEVNIMWDKELTVFKEVDYCDEDMKKVPIPRFDRIDLLKVQTD